MDKDLAWPMATLAAAAVIGGAVALAAGQAITAAAIVGLAGLAATGTLLAWRRVRTAIRSASKLLDAGAGPAGWSVDDALERLTAQAAAQQKLQQEQAKEVARKTANLQALLDGLGQPVVATGENEAVILCNRAAEAMIGAAPGGLAGVRFREAFTRPELLAMHEAARQGRTEQGEVRLTTPAGVRTYEVSAAPLPAAWGEGIFGAVLCLRDITALSQAVQMRSDFVANASHELRTPVAAILGAAETLQDGAKDDATMRDRLLNMIVQHARRLEEMTTDLMDLSRLESPDMPAGSAPVAMADVAETLRMFFEGACRERKLSLAFEIDPALAEFETDPKLLMLVLRNLVDNATKHAFEGSTVRIIARTAEGAVSGGAVMTAHFEVADRGMGIPLAQQERVFERFYQVDQARTTNAAPKGTGLGLAIVKHAVKSLGGRIGLESTWGEGTRVWAEWPVGVIADGPSAADGAEPPADGGSIQV